MKQFEDAAQAAVDSIPDEFRPYLENTVFVIEESSTDGLMGLYEGAIGRGLHEPPLLDGAVHQAAALRGGSLELAGHGVDKRYVVVA